MSYVAFFFKKEKSTSNHFKIYDRLYMYPVFQMIQYAKILLSVNVVSRVNILPGVDEILDIFAYMTDTCMFSLF